MKTANVSQSRRLRDGRRLAEIHHCPYCADAHWLITDGSTLAYVPCGPNRPVLLDGIGASVR